MEKIEKIYIAVIGGNPQQPFCRSQEKAEQLCKEYSKGAPWKVICYELKGEVSASKPLYKMF